jgi:hypothetical protein
MQTPKSKDDLFGKHPIEQWMAGMIAGDWFYRKIKPPIFGPV